MPGKRLLWRLPLRRGPISPRPQPRTCRKRHSQKAGHARIEAPEQPLAGHESLLEAIADSAHRFDVLAVRTQLLAQARHLYVDGPFRYRIVVALDCGDDRFPSKC